MQRPDNPLRGYCTGYVFFTHVPGLVADGICWFERWARGEGSLPVSHTGIVTSKSMCVEAHWEHGVQRAPLSKYLDDPRTLIVFRRPRGYSVSLGFDIAEAAESKIGTPYDKGLILSQLAANTFVGHWINKLFGGAPDRWVSAHLDRKQAFICSELVAWALKEQPEFWDRGILRQPLDTISPQELFDDETLWESARSDMNAKSAMSGVSQ